MKRLATLGLALLLSLGTVSAAERWLHVRVQEGGTDGEQVNVNIPLSLVEAILPTINTHELSGGKLRLDGRDEFQGMDLREVLAALRDAPDADFVTVRGANESVRVAKERGYLVVHADEARGDRVRIRMPLEVVDAMVAGGNNELDLLAALRALAAFDGEDLVSVESDGSHVRIWIDGSEAGH